MDEPVIYTKPKLGIFDSGVGGFSVLEEIRSVTSADILYFGDCARAPYGNRSMGEICMFMKEIIANLKLQEVTHFVSACNSMSVTMTDKILKDSGIENSKYVDMIKVFKEYVKFDNGSKAIIFGTKATISSGAYQEVLTEKNVEVGQYAFKTLAGLIERKASDGDLYEVVSSGMNYAKKIGATHIIYGCTHYPLISKIFENCARDIKWDGEFINPAKYVAKAVSKWNLEGEKNTSFEASEVTYTFKFLSEKYEI
ncbi:MAG: aspartate/glutamate racemase family protein [Candidatus Pacebacteria bacterium]|nr:aspartate/glutamate racemase family protein [Candidatus Paceibacterota bacterium]